MASTLLTKWEMTQRASLKMHQLEQRVERRTQQLTQASEALQQEIEERKQLESQLVQSEKLASLGQMAHAAWRTRSTIRSVSCPPTWALWEGTSSNW